MHEFRDMLSYILLLNYVLACIGFISVFVICEHKKIQIDVPALIKIICIYLYQFKF